MSASVRPFAPRRILIGRLQRLVLKDTEHRLKDITAVAGPIPCLPNFLLLLDSRQAFL